ncbi:MAG: hypothetical protein E7043_04865 [Lentisphaerae bacterium]|nr:hypothetical protein [Lentisphaerota bacterium]
MKMFWRKLHISRSFSVIAADAEYIRGGRFQRKGRAWKLVEFAEEKIEEQNPRNAWKKAARCAGLAEFRAVTGNIANSTFFRFPSVKMDAAAQRGAVEFELPRNMLKIPNDHCCQFCVSGKSGEFDGVMVNVAVFSGKAVNSFASQLSDAGVTADEFIHPFMAIDEKNDSLMLPEIEPDFAYIKDGWMPVSDAVNENVSVENWEKRLRKRFILPEDRSFVFRNYLMLLLAAEVIVSSKMRDCPESFRVLPDNVRPVRFRGHLIVTGILIFLLLASLVWRFALTYGSDVKEYRKITAENKALKNKTAELKKTIKRNSKELKEMTRLVAMNVGETEAISEFALFSETLPANILVSSIRWNETDIDAVVQCEDSNFDFDALFRPLKYWKVTQQQRQNPGSAVATITLKLTPYDAKDEK